MCWRNMININIIEYKVWTFNCFVSLFCLQVFEFQKRSQNLNDYEKTKMVL